MSDYKDLINEINNGKIEKINMVESMKQYFIDYSMSVIVDRSLPDVRDGLKPVHRRILYAMFDLGIVPEKGYKKCARIVGEVIGKYNPHGDSSAYGALVKLAQDFYMRYMLVDGHGNFGSVDGDGSASMRYTEAKMKKLSMELLADLKKDTVDFVPNFDGEEREPVVLPSRFPNLLVNGAYGIANFTTNIPSHNLREAINQTIYQIDNPNCTIEELVKILKAPDFATGGAIINPNDLLNMYKTGRGNITVRGQYHIEENKIIFTEIPQGVNKLNLYMDLIKLIKGYNKEIKEDGKKKIIFEKPKIPQARDVKDDSGKDGIRLIIEAKNKTDIDIILKLLFKHSQLQTNVNAIFTAVKDNQLLKEMSLKQINSEYINHQINVITRRTVFELNKTIARQHILHGMIIILNNIDNTIELIKKSKNKLEAKNKLIEIYHLDEIQAEAILKMELSKLTNLEINSMRDEVIEIDKQVEFLNTILNDNKVLLGVLKDELIKIRDKYADERRTEILYNDTLSDISIDDITIEDYNCRLAYTKQGYIKKHLKKSDNHKIKDGDMILDDIEINNKSTLLIFTDKANRYSIPVYELNTYTPSQLGDYIYNVTNMDKDENIKKVVSIPKDSKGHMIFVYNNGKIAKIDINSYMSNNKKLQNCYNTDNDLIAISYIEKDTDVLLISNEGKALIVSTGRINSKSSRNSQGVTGIKLNEGYNCIGSIIGVTKEYNFRLITEKGKSKEFMLDDVVSQDNDKRLFDYLYSRPSNMGNFLINTRKNNDKITTFELI
ncbi:DNA topoisomerase (ATP-hydrolyzing) subunit A [Clostridium botulinum]|uniref:DNA gyrase/topoisomerase IV subunit A n=1 Tax=Clostridium botulinum TaxID=1491 RepID=UPI001C9A7D21|nr:DNA topoisomerase (ATP-hydrolyzing) [Clostridium botulinum]MBY6838658.1 DNA topoisomerase 4 subunit A [Clostridium botulinum]